MESRANIDNYSKEELYDLCSKLKGVNKLYKEMLDVCNTLIKKQEEVIIALESEVKKKDTLLDQYDKLTDEMLNTMKEMTE